MTSTATVRGPVHGPVHGHCASETTSAQARPRPRRGRAGEIARAALRPWLALARAATLPATFRRPSGR